MKSDIIQYVNERMIGRIAMSDDEASLLARTVAVPGLHIEIGCLWGGTAALSALAKDWANEPGHVYTIDIMCGGFWGDVDYAINKRPDPRDALENILRFGLAGKISVIRANTNPWPLSSNIRPETALIDGDHSSVGCLSDWLSLKFVTEQAIMFHDYDEKHQGVKSIVDEVARKDEDWNVKEQVGSLIVFGREQ